ncbi:MAG: hypothetical protein J5958_05510 [Clostridia bacterium]|nr:hypothetical protein [Clostridia bacterium]
MKIGRLIGLVLALVLLTGVTVSCIRSLSSEGSLFTSIGSWFGGSVSSGGTSGGSSGGLSPFGGGSMETPSTGSIEAGGSTEPLPENYWDVGNQRYHLSGYTAYPASSCSPTWFRDALGDDMSYSQNGSNFVFEKYHSILTGCFSFGTVNQGWSLNSITAVAVSFTLDPSACCDFFGSVCCSFGSNDQAYEGYCPLFKVEDHVFYLVSDEWDACFYEPSDIADVWPEPANFGNVTFAEEGELEDLRVLFVYSNFGFTIYVNDQFSLYLVPELIDPGYYYLSIDYLLRLTFDGDSSENAVLNNVCFYIK